MPTGIFLIWPALHLLFGASEVHNNRLPTKRLIPGSLLLMVSAVLIGQPYGWEHGLFYWLFALMALGLSFVQLRIWQPVLVIVISAASLILLIMQAVNDTGGGL